MELRPNAHGLRELDATLTSLADKETHDISIDMSLWTLALVRPPESATCPAGGGRVKRHVYKSRSETNGESGIDTEHHCEQL